MATLRSELEKITNDFVTSVLAAMRSASLGDLIEQANGAAGPGAPVRVRAIAPAAPVAGSAAKPAKRRHRASADDVRRQKETALGAAKGLKPGFSKGEVMKKTGSKVDLGRALTLLVADGKLSKKGDRRMTRYWVK